MQKAEIAELILSLFTSRDRAASTVGDLVENTPGRSAWGFWLGVCRIALSLSWSSFAADPSFMASIGFRGLIVNLSLNLALFICILIFAAVFGLIVGLSHISLSTAKDLSLGVPRFRWIFLLAGCMATYAVQFQTGRWIARRSRDREMAACAAFLLVHLIVMPIIGEFLFGGRWLGNLTNGPYGVTVPITGASLIIDNLMALIALFAGAIWLRCHLIDGTPPGPI